MDDEWKWHPPSGTGSAKMLGIQLKYTGAAPHGACVDLSRLDEAWTAEGGFVITVVNPNNMQSWLYFQCLEVAARAPVALWTADLSKAMRFDNARTAQGVLSHRALQEHLAQVHSVAYLESRP